MIRTFLLYILPYVIIKRIAFNNLQREVINKPGKFEFVEIEQGVILGRAK